MSGERKNIIDFALEGNRKAALLVGVRALERQLQWTLLDAENRPTRYVTIVVHVPQGASTAGIPDGFILRGPLVHRDAVRDDEGNEVEPAVLSTNWHLDIRLTGPAADLDRDNDGIEEVSRSKIKTWIKEHADNIVTSPTRASLNSDYPDPVLYYEKTLEGGDWIRLYPHLKHPKLHFAGTLGRAN